MFLFLKNDKNWSCSGIYSKIKL